MAGLLGDINDPVFPGDRFRFGYNVGYTAGPFVAANVAGVLESEGLSYDTFSYILAGVFNAFISVEGNSASYWNSALDLRSAIYNAINGAGYPIQPQSVQIDFPQGQGNVGPNAIPSPADVASGSGGAVPPGTLPPPNRVCDFHAMNLPDWLACQLGVTTTSATIIGAVVGIGLFIAVTRRG